MNLPEVGAPPLRSPLAARVSLLLLLAAAASIGLTATFAPHSFYDDFPSSPTGSTSCPRTTSTW